MSANAAFRRLLVVAGLTTLILAVASLSPLLASRLFMGGAALDKGALLVCLFLPTPEDWPSHLLSYALALLLAAGISLGAASLVSQWYRTRRLVGALLQFSWPGAAAPGPRARARVDARAGGNAAFGAPDVALVTTLDAGPGAGPSAGPSAGAGCRPCPRMHALASSVGLQGRVTLIFSERAVAFCYGWFKPRVCMSTGVLDELTDAEVQALLLHERHHLVQRDPLRTSIARVLASAYFFLPVLRALSRQYLVLREIEADREVVEHQGTDRPLLGALYKLLMRQSGRAGGAGGAGSYGARREGGTSGEEPPLAVAGAADSINQRLDYLLHGRQPAGLRMRLLFGSSLALAAVSTMLMLATWIPAGSTLWYQAHIGTC